ncbi:MAG: hypothetical protein R3264_10935 [Anaerolineae bacterium]|nr:hypothetical protein [Anaerolineae bacterium]
MAKLGRRESPSPHSEISNLNPLVIESVVTPTLVTSLNLDQSDRDFVKAHLKWLFHAVDNFQQVYEAGQRRFEAEREAVIRDLKNQQADWDAFARDSYDERQQKAHQAVKKIRAELWQETIAQHPPVKPAIPDHADQTPAANNRVIITPESLNKLTEFEGILRTDPPFQAEMARIDTHLKTLSKLLHNSATLGQAGTANQALQGQISYARQQIVHVLQELAGDLKMLYGVFVTAPDELAKVIDDV